MDALRLEAVSRRYIAGEAASEHISSLRQSSAAALIMLFCFLAILNTMLMASADRRRDLATLRLSGATARQAVASFACEALLIGALGALLAVAATIISPAGIEIAMHTVFQKTAVVISWQPILIVTATSVALAMIGTIVPSSPRYAAPPPNMAAFGNDRGYARRGSTKPAGCTTRRSSPSSTSTRTTRSAPNWPARSRSCSTSEPMSAHRPGPTTQPPTPGSLSAREPVSLVPGLNFDDLSGAGSQPGTHDRREAWTPRNLLTFAARRDDANRRLCNQAFFTKVYLDEDDHLRVENARPFEMLLDPEINANALTWAADADKARTTANDSSGQGSSLVRQVPRVGLEPTLNGV